MKALPSLVVLAALTALTAGASATAPVLPERDWTEISALAQRYLANRAQKVTSGPQTPGFGVPVTPALAAKLRDHEAKLEVARTSWSPQRYRAAEVTTRVGRLDVHTRDTAVAHVSERGDLYFQEEIGPLFTSYGLDHLLTVRRENGGWVLADVALGRYQHCRLLPETQSPTC